MFSEGIERDQLHKIGHVLIQNSSLFFPFFFLSCKALSKIHQKAIYSQKMFEIFKNNFSRIYFHQ